MQITAVASFKTKANRQRNGGDRLHLYGPYLANHTDLLISRGQLVKIICHHNAKLSVTSSLASKIKPTTSQADQTETNLEFKT